jgi:hypothetical protein
MTFRSARGDTAIIVFLVQRVWALVFHWKKIQLSTWISDNNFFIKLGSAVIFWRVFRYWDNVEGLYIDWVMADWKKIFFANSAEHFYEVVSSPVGVKFLGGGINEDCEHESCQAFFWEMNCFRQRDIATAIWWDLARQRCDWYLAYFASKGGCAGQCRNCLTAIAQFL